MKHFIWIFMLTLNAHAQAVLSGNGALSGNAALAFTAAGGGGGAPGVESFSFNSASAGSPSVGDISQPTTNGGNNRLQFVVLGIGLGSAVTCTVSNSAGNVFTAIWNTNAATWGVSLGFYLTNPPSGSNMVYANFSSTPAFQAGMVVANITNAHQTAPLGTPDKNWAATGNPSITVASATSELVIGGCTSDAQNALAVSGGTEIKIILNIGTDVDVGAAYYTGAASVNAAWTDGATGDWSAGAVSIKPP